MKLSMEDAAYVIGKSKKTIYNHKDKNKFSYEIDNDGKAVIDVSEIFRVYGDSAEITERLKKLHSGESVKESENTPAYTQENQDDQEQFEVVKLKAELEKEKALRERVEDEVEYFKTALQKSQDTANQITLLLEDKTKDGSGQWENSFKALENRIANQEKSAKEREEREQKILRQNRALRNALKEEQSKSIWKKLFG